MAIINKLSTLSARLLAAKPTSLLGNTETAAASNALDLAVLGISLLPAPLEAIGNVAAVEPFFVLDPVVVDPVVINPPTIDCDLSNPLPFVVMGTSGDDTLYGNGGVYTLAGGAGNDTYYIDTDFSFITTLGNDTVTENADEGFDTVIENADEGIDTLYLINLAFSRQFTLGDNIENVIVTNGYPEGHTTTYPDGALILTISENSVGLNYRYINGNALNNQITGGAQDDWLDGKAGADTLVGGLGSDAYVVDNIGDVVTELANEGYDKVISSFDYTLGDNLEALRLTGSENLTGTGNALNNTLIGNGGDNLLLGGAGNDSIKGGAGNDTLTGGDGNDTFYFNPDQITAGDVDIITDFVSGSDKINLDSLYLGNNLNHFYSGANMTTAQSDGAQVIYDSNTGELYYDADGIGGVDAIHFATLTGAPTVIGSDVSGRSDNIYWVPPDILVY